MELLELAAKANWAQELADDEVALRYSESDDGMLYLHADNQDHNGCDHEFRWNPLVEDHDALRLAVKLRMRIAIDSLPAGTVMIYPDNRDSLCTQEIIDGDPYAATRRAIVRAAAEIGRKDCSNARLSPGAECGHDAVLWTPRDSAEQSDLFPA
ncbi:hypothetical protein [Cupriavidus sp. TKC]|uniref:hypothetical protein n=1 Tax=Cupriavidus sp. TKC TaxID=2880159 RepID=UPI00295EFCDB|nr:hypothetical protein [Cupriavidus sp. TKC]